MSPQASPRPKPPAAGKGRPKGAINKATREIRAIARRLTIGDKVYMAALRKRLRSGKAAPAVEVLLHHYASGKPKDTVSLENPDGSPLGPLVQFYLPDNGRDIRST